MVTADQLVAHAVGDYVVQSDWMALEKTKRSVAAAAHAASYTLPYARRLAHMEADRQARGRLSRD